jgi:FecR protein
MSNKPLRPRLEWVTIPKRRLYTVAALLGALALFSVGVYLWWHNTHRAPAHEESQAVAGALYATFTGAVRVVRANTRETIFATEDTHLQPGDIVQTEANGRASIMLADGSTLLVRPNSVVTISENAGASAGNAARVRVAVAGGQVSVSTEAQPPATSSVVETPQAGNRLSAQTAVSFDVHEDKSEEMRVSSGVVTRDTHGTKTTIQAGEYVSFDQAGALNRREPLLDAPVPYAPADGAKIWVPTAGTTVITLQWTHPQAATAAYHVEIASSPFFVKAGIVFERDQLVAPKLLVTALGAGTYYWRVRAVAPKGQTSEWSAPQKFTIAPEAGVTNRGATKD